MRWNIIFWVCLQCFMANCIQRDNMLDKLVYPADEFSNVIEIDTERTWGNILEKRKSTLRTYQEDFESFKEFECSEFAILPEHRPHIWIGNVLTKKSIQDLLYTPLSKKINPIIISSTLLDTESKTIIPSYSNFSRFVKDCLSATGDVRETEMSVTIEQFTSYNELKMAFGTNLNTSGLFSSSHSSSHEKELKITKATGLYVKFIQSSFSIIMDYPIEPLVSDISSEEMGKYAYINSVTYGQMGILAIETNYTASDAEMYLRRIIKKIFSTSNNYYSQEEYFFLEGCSFKLYLVGGNSSAVNTFAGYEEFLKYIHKARFSKENPGVPIYYTMANLKDNSLFKSIFKLSVRKEPLYVEIKGAKKDSNHKVDIDLLFYRNRAKIPTIADPRIRFFIEKKTEDDDHFTPNYEELVFQNAGYQTSLRVLSDAVIYQVYRRGCHGGGRYGRECDTNTLECTYTLKDSPFGDYIILGNPVISR